MGILEYVLGGVLIALAAFLVVAVLLQTGKDKKLSGSIAGGADTYYNQSRGHRRDRILAITTTVVAVVFAVLVVVLYVLIANHYSA
ncbi:MAG: preprotein translocase subunit SecG [Clostridia bacterium]|nr:preprotein translocase subunit SecG [Clostridia bacterium]